MTLFLFLLMLFLSLVFIKYIIDTKSTIKELRLDRDKFRSIAWKSHINKDTGQKLNWLYKNIKAQLLEIIKDLEDTDFVKYDGDIKNDIISALKNIDSYSDKIEHDDMDTLNIYKDNSGKTK